MFLNCTYKKLLLLFVLSVFSFSAFSDEENAAGKCEKTIAGNQENSESAPADASTTADQALSLAEVLNTKVEDYYEFNVRVHKTLSDAKIVYVGDLVQKTKEGLSDVPGLGKVSVDLVAQEVEGKGDDLSLGMELDKGWNQHGFMAGTRRAATRVGGAVSSGASATGRGAAVAGRFVAGAASTVTPSKETLKKAASATTGAVSSGVSATGRGARATGRFVAGMTPSVDSLKRAANAPFVASANVRNRVQTNRQRRQDQAAEQQTAIEALLSMKIEDYLKSRLGFEPVDEGKDPLEEAAKMAGALGIRSQLDYVDFINSKDTLMNVLPNHVSSVEELTQKSKADLLEIEDLDERNIYWLEKVLSNDDLSLRTIRLERTRRIGSAAATGTGSAVRSGAGSLGRGARATGRFMAGAANVATMGATANIRARYQANAERNSLAKSLSKPVEDLNSHGIPAIVVRAIKYAGIPAYEDLARKTREELLSIQGIQPKSVDSIEAVFAEEGLSLGMTEEQISQIKSKKAVNEDTSQETDSTGESKPEETVENASITSRIMSFFRRSAEEPEVKEDESNLEDTTAEDTTPAEESDTTAEETTVPAEKSDAIAEETATPAEESETGSENASETEMNKTVVESLSKPVEDLTKGENRIPWQALQAIQDAGIHTYEDLARKTRVELVNLRNVGPTSVDTIEETLTVEGLSLGMTDAEIDQIKSAGETQDTSEVTESESKPEEASEGSDSKPEETA